MSFLVDRKQQQKLFPWAKHLTVGKMFNFPFVLSFGEKGEGVEISRSKLLSSCCIRAGWISHAALLYMADLASYDESLQSSVSRDVLLKKKSQCRCHVVNFVFKNWFFFNYFLKHGRNIFNQMWLFQKIVKIIFINLCLEAPSEGRENSVALSTAHLLGEMTMSLPTRTRQYTGERAQCRSPALDSW